MCERTDRIFEARPAPILHHGVGGPAGVAPLRVGGTRRLNDRRRFSFGRNWQKYLDDLPPEATDAMRAYVAEWLPPHPAGAAAGGRGAGAGAAPPLLCPPA